MNDQSPPSTGQGKHRETPPSTNDRSPPSTKKRPVSPPSTGRGKHRDTHRLQTTGLLPAHRNDRSLLPGQAKESTVSRVYKRPVRPPCTGQGKHCGTYRLQTTSPSSMHRPRKAPWHIPSTNDRSPPSTQAKESTVAHTVYKRPVSSQHTGQAGKPPHTSALH